MPKECNGNPSTLSYKEMRALRQIAKAVGSPRTVVKLDKAMKIKTRPLGTKVQQ